jgi:hypothetical protein
MIAIDTIFRHDQVLVGFKPIDDLHREFQDILDALMDPTEADFGKDLLALRLASNIGNHCQTCYSKHRYPLEGAP